LLPCSRRVLSEAHFGPLPIPSGGFTIHDRSVQAGSELTTAPRSRSIVTGFDQYAVVGTHNRDRGPLRRKSARSDGTLSGQGSRVCRCMLPNPRHQLTRAVVDDDLHQGRTAARVDDCAEASTVPVNVFRDARVP